MGEDDYQMSLCVEKKKKDPFLLEKLSFTLLDYTELSVTWAEDVQTVSVDLDNSDGKDIFKKKLNIIKNLKLKYLYNLLLLDAEATLCVVLVPFIAQKACWMLQC